ncbi:hypothetical protein J1N35_036526 [Gossypium stocksii]|uniref:RNase H type-1 domain-containing protein n=1 Tax=Gossypium stocksii TaxID=47602 RepID=A0A9D3UIH1_9ROSI|nr:hypothetical protein J1N35_036526 [Gossypium stocksii]
MRESYLYSNFGLMGVLRHSKAKTCGLICDQHGTWISSFSRNIGNCSVIDVELWGALKGLQLAWNIGLKRINLELDSTEAIQENIADQYYSALTRTIKNM